MVGSPLRASNRLTPSSSTGSALEVTKQILGRTILGAVFLASGIVWEAPPVFIGALIVAGSSIPIWLRAKRSERMGVSGDVRRLETRLEQRLQDAEDRVNQQAVEIDENARQMAELEERLDFTERLLTRQREET
jgi:hypothetical protein